MQNPFKRDNPPQGNLFVENKERPLTVTAEALKNLLTTRDF